MRNPFFPVAVWKIANYPGGDCWPARSAYSGTTGVRASTRGSHTGTETKVSRESVCYWEIMFIVIKLHRRTRKKKFEFSQQKWTRPVSCMRHVGAGISLSLNIKGNWIRGTAFINGNRIILTWTCDYQLSSWPRISIIQPRLRKLTQGFDYSEYNKSLNNLKLKIATNALSHGTQLNVYLQRKNRNCSWTESISLHSSYLFWVATGVICERALKWVALRSHTIHSLQSHIVRSLYIDHLPASILVSKNL